MYQITKVERFSDSTYLWEVFAPDVARAARPGQFIMLRLDEGGERIPLTIADFDARRGTITLVIQAVGRTTEEMNARYEEGDWFLDFVGPLGLASPIDNSKKHIVVVGGGLGVAPIFPILRRFHELGVKTTAIIGFRNKDLVFWEEKFRPFCDELIVCTDDGSYGRKGFVTQPLKELVSGENPPDHVVAIGPLVMMRAAAETTRPFGIHTETSLNAIMVDGTGMCGSCRVKIDGEIKFACVDGPDFDAHKVDFQELITRQSRFKSHEQEANEDYQQVCSLEKTLIEEGKRNYRKIKEVAHEMQEMPERDAEERSKNFKEVNLGYGWEEALLEAERCLQCKMPLCVMGCPVNIDIPGFIRNILVRDLEGALETIHKTNLFPSICGRVCPQESQCEAQCIVSKKHDSVAIGRLERFVGDFAPVKKQHPPQRPIVQRSVAVVGSGPAGLACAGDLARAGVDVTVFEALHVVGGVLRYGIPSFRLPREIISREVNGLKELGVKFEVNKVVGTTYKVPELMDRMGYDAVFIGVGAGYPVFLNLPGEGAGQVYSANEYLTRINLMGGDKFPLEDTPVQIGNNVVVIGAGNTAMDCLRVSKRIGADNVTCIYRRTRKEAPARIEEVRHAIEEGIEFRWLRSPLEIYEDEKGNVKGIKVQVMKLGEPDANGRRRPIPVEGEIEEIEADTVIYALGTRANPVIPKATPELELNRWGNIVATEDSQATNMPGVFAGGDIVSGGATVILALGAGRTAAKGIIQWIEGGKKQWPPIVEIFDIKKQIKAEAKRKKAGIKEPKSTCPRCGLSLESDEAYICCADEQLSWTCTTCQKRYEGFAFPYGHCSSCGGKLKHQEQEHIDPQTEAIRQAMEIELGGLAFYADGAKNTDDPVLKELFERLSDMERNHMKILAERYHIAIPDETLVLTTKAASIVVGLDKDVKNGEELLQLALKLELRAKAFFMERTNTLEEGSDQWKLYRELEAEEYAHVAMIETELNAYREGKKGILQ